MDVFSVLQKLTQMGMGEGNEDDKKLLINN